MNADLSKIHNELVSEIHLSSLISKIFLLVTIEGKMTDAQIAKKLNVSTSDALASAEKLVEIGAFIDMPLNEFEAMHPRFTAVNMYRKMCKRENIEFKRNKIVDNIGVALEPAYDSARTK